MQQGIDKGQKEFVDDKNIKNITMLAEANYPNKFLFNEVAGILSNPAVEIPDNADDNMSLLFRQYENEIIDFATMLKGMIYKETSSQYSFHTEKSIKLLRKVGA